MRTLLFALLVLPGLARAQTTVGGAAESPEGRGLTQALGAGFRIVDRSELSPGGSHTQIPLKKGKYAIMIYSRSTVTSKSGKTAEISGIPLNFLTGGCPWCIDVEFKAAISPTPGDFNVPAPCKIPRVDNDGPNQMKALSNIKVMVDPGNAKAEPGSRRASYLDQAKKLIAEGKVCLLKPGKVYYYNIAGDCDWELIAKRESHGREYSAEAKRTCQVRMPKGPEGMLTRHD